MRRCSVGIPSSWRRYRGKGGLVNNWRGSASSVNKSRLHSLKNKKSSFTCWNKQFSPRWSRLWYLRLLVGLAKCATNSTTPFTDRRYSPPHMTRPQDWVFGLKGLFCHFDLLKDIKRCKFILLRDNLVLGWDANSVYFTISTYTWRLVRAKRGRVAERSAPMRRRVE